MLDAGPIIGLHELGIWTDFAQRYEVVIPQVVCEDEALFHSRDDAAIQAACLLGMSERCESVEALLRLVGLGREVPWSLSKRFMEHHKQEGGKRVITGFGLAG
jgi:hypothetical protein